MENQTKMQILERLVKDGSITLAEAFALNEPEIKIVETQPLIGWPVTNPWTPFQNERQSGFYYGGTSTDVKYPLTFNTSNVGVIDGLCGLRIQASGDNLYVTNTATNN